MDFRLLRLILSLLLVVGSGALLACAVPEVAAEECRAGLAQPEFTGAAFRSRRVGSPARGNVLGSRARCFLAGGREDSTVEAEGRQGPVAGGSAASTHVHPLRC
jgi:hypothetical protein